MREKLKRIANGMLNGNIINILFVYSDGDTVLKLYDDKNRDEYNNPKYLYTITV
jgi:hypothetical protein